MIYTSAFSSGYAQRVLLLAVGMVLGAALALAITSTGLGWWGVAVGLGFALAVMAGIVQRCST